MYNSWYECVSHMDVCVCVLEMQHPEMWAPQTINYTTTQNVKHDNRHKLHIIYEHIRWVVSNILRHTHINHTKAHICHENKNPHVTSLLYRCLSVGHFKFRYFFVRHSFHVTFKKTHSWLNHQNRVNTIWNNQKSLSTLHLHVCVCVKQPQTKLKLRFQKTQRLVITNQ